jgi:hypothetical protein
MAFDELSAHLELTLRATASLLHDLIRIDCALQLRNAFDDRPRSPSGEAPAVRAVTLTSFASRPVKARLRSPKVRSQVRAVISTLLVRQTTESAVTEIVLLGVKPKLVLPPNSRAIILLSKARTTGECCAITAANARAVGPVAVTSAATAACCPTMVKAARRMNLVICAVSKVITTIMYKVRVPSAAC